MIVHVGLLEHFITDMLLKVAIVGVGALIVVIAMVILWRMLS